MDEKIELARQLYVEQGKALPDIAVSLDINLGPLRAHAIANNWDDAREAFLAARQRVIDENDLLGQQEYRLRDSNLKLTTLRMEHEIARHTPQYNARSWRDTVECEQRMHQMLVEQIKAERLINGVKPNAPSVAPDAEEVSGVKYIVRMEQEKRESKTA